MIYTILDMEYSPISGEIVVLIPKLPQHIITSEVGWFLKAHWVLIVPISCSCLKVLWSTI